VKTSHFVGLVVALLVLITLDRMLLSAPATVDERHATRSKSPSAGSRGSRMPWSDGSSYANGTRPDGPADPPTSFEGSIPPPPPIAYTADGRPISQAGVLVDPRVLAAGGYGLLPGYPGAPGIVGSTSRGPVIGR
jgi:hypothetical protein